MTFSRTRDILILDEIARLSAEFSVEGVAKTSSFFILYSLITSKASKARGGESEEVIGKSEEVKGKK